MIYLLGGRGYVGQAYQRLFKAMSIDFKTIVRESMDYTDVATLEAALKRDRPDFLINAAGFTGKPNVDACEDARDACLFGNAVLPGRIARACGEAGILWGHVSSGCIYTGSREDGIAFTEQDEPNCTFRQDNGSFYSGSKALGEEVLSNAEGVYIWRLRMPFNHQDGPRNFLSKLMRYEKLLDATNSISQLDEFAAATFASWQKKLQPGTYNVTNPGQVTTREVVEWIRESGVCEREFRFFESEQEFMRTAARTPRSNCVISSAKLAAAGIHLTPVKQAVQTALANWEEADS